MVRTEHDPLPDADVHLAALLDDYAAGRLDSEREEDVEGHLLVCDACFAAYVATLVRRD